MESYKTEIYEQLIKMSEKELQSSIIEPLLRMQGFSHVRDTSGPHEKGKDLIAIKTELGRTKLYAIQIKRMKYSGKQTMPNSLTGLIHQLRQIFGEPVLDPTTNYTRTPDRCIFITPYKINTSALESALGQMRDLERHEISIIDGTILIDEVIKNIPQVLKNLSLENSYRMRLYNELNKIPEASGIGVGLNVTIEDIYVDVSYETEEDLISILINGDVASQGYMVLSEERSVVESAKNVLAQWQVKGPHIWNNNFHTSKSISEAKDLETKLKDRKEQIGKKVDDLKSIYVEKMQLHNDDLNNIEKEIKSLENDRLKYEEKKYKEKVEELKRKKSRMLDDVKYTKSNYKIQSSKLSDELDDIKNIMIIEVNLDKIITHAKEEAKKCQLKLSQLASPDISYNQKTMIVKSWVDIRNRVLSLTHVSFIREHLNKCIKFNGNQNQKRANISLPVHTISEIKHPVLLIGGPGTGKTTILRWLTREISTNKKGIIPIFQFLAKMNSVENARSIFDQCFMMLNKDLQLKRTDFISKVRDGRIVFIFDGLDELGANASEALNAISILSSQHSACQFIVSSRDTIETQNWNEAFTIKTIPFDDEQLDLFITKWFSTQPSKILELKKWLKNNKKMSKVAKMPIIAALLCFLYQVGEDMPNTEVDLYNNRLLLLLGRWEQAKGIEPLPSKERKCYEMFLMELAYYAHIDMQRSIEFSQAVNIANDYYSPGFHRSAISLLNDCIHRGLLLIDDNDELSFGHFTYQEFLVGKWLCHKNAVQLIWEHLNTNWWAKAIDFYVLLKGDISSLLDGSFREGRKWTEEKRIRILKLARLAPVTQRNIRERLARLEKNDPYLWGRT